MIRIKIIMGFYTKKLRDSILRRFKMLNNEKIILMTKLSLYEQKNQKKEIKTSKYFRGDYMSLKMLKSFLCITVAYLLCWFYGLCISLTRLYQVLQQQEDLQL